MNTYARRAVKYFIYLTLLFFAIYGIMYVMKATTVETFLDVFRSQRGLMMLSAVVVLSLLYPRFGFVERTVKLNPEADREAIDKVMSVRGYVLASKQNNVEVYRAEMPLKKITRMWEDTITLTINEDSISMQGPRKDVVTAEFALKSYILK